MSINLEFTPEIQSKTDELYKKIQGTIPKIEWPTLAPYIFEINKIKKEKGVTILAHNYQAPEIYYGVADIVGDSLGLAIDGGKVDTDKILMCGVHFMAETAKIMSPEKKIILPDFSAGCSLAESITAEDVKKLKKDNPGVPVVTYVNTSADVKAETDICCTSANAVKIIESLNVDKVIFLPDEYLAKYVASKTNVEIISWNGKCEVHERFTDKEIFELRKKYPSLKVVSHPECPPDVIKASDYTGSTGSMINYVKNTEAKDIFLVTECSMSDNIQIENPDINFVKPCNLCPHMKKITLQGILRSLKEEINFVEIDSKIIQRAKGAIEKMIAVGR
ncbi:MAG: quinolinate synthase NadA [Pelagibacteraceae bacterium]